jgi:hypothetical protein
MDDAKVSEDKELPFLKTIREKIQQPKKNE